ncbi:TPA: hypothetical protein IDZ30_002892 [Escherichia coli]|nr:hypothetical protein [Escherichia coli]
MDADNILYSGMFIFLIGFAWIFGCIIRMVYPKKVSVFTAPGFSGAVTLPKAGDYAVTITLPLKSGIASYLPGASFYSAQFTITASESQQAIALQRKGKWGANSYNKDFIGNKSHIIGVFNCPQATENYDIVCTNPQIIHDTYKVEIINYISLGKRMMQTIPGWILVFIAVGLIIIPQVS